MAFRKQRCLGAKNVVHSPSRRIQTKKSYKYKFPSFSSYYRSRYEADRINTHSDGLNKLLSAYHLDDPCGLIFRVILLLESQDKSVVRFGTLELDGPVRKLPPLDRAALLTDYFVEVPDSVSQVVGFRSCFHETIELCGNSVAPWCCKNGQTSLLEDDRVLGHGLYVKGVDVILLINQVELAYLVPR